MNITMNISLENPEDLNNIPKCYYPKPVIDPIAIPRKGDILFLGDKGSFLVKRVSWQFNEEEIIVTVTIE